MKTGLRLPGFSKKHKTQSKTNPFLNLVQGSLLYELYSMYINSGGDAHRPDYVELWVFARKISLWLVVRVMFGVRVDKYPLAIFPIIIIISVVWGVDPWMAVGMAAFIGISDVVGRMGSRYSARTLPGEHKMLVKISKGEL